ncbi:hypothetical protein ThesiDRAFT1_1856 [Thermoanaerobacter siderophilus SR4]|uniref:Uncharacterized protein n=1 Tax=Thermoanaerobacter siderophilus SR4 TaxID=880478 RepID=I9KV19_9THEO|nr:hypothetical protein ThesiDRAFT1_1856 [Thermoanaerobacter siderophilus SR4]
MGWKEDELLPYPQRKRANHKTPTAGGGKSKPQPVPKKKKFPNPEGGELKLPRESPTAP